MKAKKKKEPTYKEAMDIAKSLALTAYDFDSYMFVRIRTDEGFEATYPSAFFLTIGKTWFAIFAEHHPCSVWDRGEVELIRQYSVEYQTEEVPIEGFVACSQSVAYYKEQEQRDMGKLKSNRGVN